MKLRVLSILLLIGVMGFLGWQSGSPRDAGKEDRTAKSAERRDPDADADPFAGIGDEGGDAKSQIRSDPGTVSIDGTFAELRKPLPVAVDYPEQTLRERIAAFNATLKEAGVEPQRLRIQVNEQHESKEVLLDMKVPAFAAEKALPAEILQHCCDAVIVRYQVKEGVAIITPSG